MRYVYTKKPYIARCFSFLWYKRVYIGEGMKGMSMRMAIAVLLHEHFHCDKQHTLWRLFVFLTCPWWLKKLAHRQEFDADVHAAKEGFAKELIEFLESRKGEAGPWHPSRIERIARLKKYEQSRSTSVKGQLASSA